MVQTLDPMRRLSGRVGPFPKDIQLHRVAVSAYEHYRFVSPLIFDNGGSLSPKIWVDPHWWGHPEIEIGFEDEGDRNAFCEILDGEGYPYRLAS